ncbi:terpene synthase family protein [Streptomyces sp. NPDC003703]|uniref:terpene synthase family protein n=1 Tax=Streptomyces sp. NPDC003283 TaxID=3364681 RepID=UPI0036C84A51
MTVVLPSPFTTDLQHWPFDLPFPAPPAPADHPHHLSVFGHTGRWLRETGVLATDADVSVYQVHDVPAWAVLCYPEAPLEALRLISDFISLAAQWDHLLSTPPHRGRGVEMFEPMLAVLDGGPPGAGQGPYAPYVRAWSDVWARWQRGMPSVWRERTAGNWRRALEALVVEDTAEREGRVMTIEEKTTVRDETGLQPLTLDLLERGGGYILPSSVLATPEMRALERHTGREVWLTNEVQSLPKEEAAGESNLVLLLEREKGLDREQALGLVHRMVREHTDAFLAAEAAVPHALDTLGMAPEDRSAVYRHIAGMRALMAGTVAWCGHSGRYSGPAAS